MWAKKLHQHRPQIEIKTLNSGSALLPLSLAQHPGQHPDTAQSQTWSGAPWTAPCTAPWTAPSTARSTMLAGGRLCSPRVRSGRYWGVQVQVVTCISFQMALGLWWCRAVLLGNGNADFHGVMALLRNGMAGFHRGVVVPGNFTASGQTHWNDFAGLCYWGIWLKLSLFFEEVLILRTFHEATLASYLLPLAQRHHAQPSNTRKWPLQCV